MEQALNYLHHVLDMENTNGLHGGRPPTREEAQQYLERLLALLPTNQTQEG
ncbi:hypothetical protein [Ectothiorhodospira shaposhnikovii]|uniref:hypothetical protein n=1 Tax=Ectothiorhodospira shaposhnikovii TaxID=1054 RepID=UPI001EE94FAD|nr:hypothetical protein [Ectothiorhodospira shaposhnikovii]MCG5512816.1 hypothetical protein [Ectothiorhodospira shaposhnikovii]